MRNPAPEKPGQARKRRFSRIALLMLVVILSIPGGLAGFIYLNKGKIRDIVIGEINQFLLIPVDVGDIEPGFWQHFPYVSVDFIQVETREPLRIPGQARLLKANHIYLKMHPLDILRKNYRIRRIVIEGAELNLLLFADGSDNFHVFKSSPESKGGELEIRLDAVGLRKVDFRFRDLATDQDYQFILERIDLKGRLSDENFDASLSGDLDVKVIRAGDAKIMENRSANISTRLRVEGESGKIILRNGKISTDAINMQVAGLIIPGEQTDSLDLEISSGSAAIEELLELLPKQIQELGKTHQCSGTFSYKMAIEGLIGGGMFPSISADWQLENGALLVCTDSRVWIKNFEAEGRYDNKRSPTLENQTLLIPSVIFTLGGNPFKLSVFMEGLYAPKVEGKVQASMDLADVLACPGKDWPYDIGGMADVEGSFSFQLEPGWRMAQNWSDVLHLDAKGAIREGKLIHSDLALRLEKLSGAIRLKDQGLVLQNIEAKSPEGPIKLDLRFDGFLPWIENNRNKAYVEILLHATELPLEKWFSEGSGSQENGFSLGSVEADIRVSIDKVNYRGFKASQLTGDVNYSASGLISRKLILHTMGGKLNLKGNLLLGPDIHRLTCMADLQNINMTELFLQLNNFGQEEITHKNLQGILTADVELSMNLDKTFYPIASSISALANVGIKEGVVKDYAPLKDLAKFIRTGNLDRVSIAPLQNQIYVRDSRIFIPEMAVNTDAINLSISGTHYFNNQLDYSFQVLLSEILGKKARESRKENAEFGIVEDDGLGKTRLFLRMTGTSDNPVFSYDRKSLIQKVGKDLDAEKKEVRSVLREEFQWLRQDSVKREQRKADKRKLKQQENGEFLYDWDEE